MHRQIFRRGWIAVVFVGVLIATHGFALYHAFSRTTWTIAGALAILVLLAHFGIFGSIYVFLRGRFRH